VKIEWQESLSVGVPEIDHQHKLLFGKFNALLAAWLDGKGANELIHLLKFLNAYMVSHFADEEHLMQRIGFPEVHQHRQVHLAFTRQVATFKDRLKSEGATPDLATEVNMTMTKWLIKHISNMDRAVGNFVREQNLKTHL
jgi:hemerythrin